MNNIRLSQLVQSSGQQCRLVVEQLRDRSPQLSAFFDQSYDIFENFQGQLSNDFPLLLLSLQRNFTYTAAVMVLFNLLFERVFAIVFVRDYEYFRRRWITWMIHLYSNGTQLFLALAYTTSELNELQAFFPLQYKSIKAYCRHTTIVNTLISRTSRCSIFIK